MAAPLIKCSRSFVAQTGRSRMTCPSAPLLRRLRSILFMVASTPPQRLIVSHNSSAGHRGRGENWKEAFSLLRGGGAAPNKMMSCYLKYSARRGRSSHLGRFGSLAGPPRPRRDFGSTTIILRRGRPSWKEGRIPSLKIAGRSRCPAEELRYTISLKGGIWECFPATFSRATAPSPVASKECRRAATANRAHSSTSTGISSFESTP